MMMEATNSPPAGDGDGYAGGEEDDGVIEGAVSSPAADLRLWLQEAGINDDMLQRVMDILVAEDVTTVELLRSSWQEVKHKLRAAPRALCAEALGLEVSEEDSVDLEREPVVVRCPSFQRREHDDAPMNGGSEDAENVDIWQMGSSSAEVVLMLGAISKEDVSNHGRIALQTRRMHFFEWREGGYARHALSAKELLQCLRTKNIDELTPRPSAREDDEKATIAARDLRKLDPSLSRRNAKAALPFLMVRQGAVIFAAADVSLYTIVLSDRALLLTPAKDTAVKEMIPRLEGSRRAVATAAAMGHDFADGGPPPAPHFGLHALDAVLGELCIMIHRRAGALLAETTRLGGGSGDGNGDGQGRRRSDSDGEHRLQASSRKATWSTDLQSQRDDLARLTVEQQHLSSVAEALIEDLKAVLEKDTEVACLTAALGVAEADVEALLESRLHDLTDVSAGLESAQLHISLLGRGLTSRENHIRNRLLHFDVITSATSTGLAFGGVVAGIFGMNVSQQSWMFQDDSWGETFLVVCICIALCVVLLTLSIVGMLWREEIQHKLPRHAWGSWARALPRPGHGGRRRSVGIVKSPGAAPNDHDHASIPRKV